MEGFVYVVNPPEIPRVAFGSGMERVTLAMSGPSLTPFMRKMQGEVRDFPGPFEYFHTKGLEIKYPSTLGYSSFASKLPRLPPTNISRFPPIGAYDVEPWKKPKQAARPFNVGSKYADDKKLLTPSPADYAFNKPATSLKICSAFGCKRIFWPAVAIICTPINTAKCSKCNRTPIGDYFHQFQLNLDMCRRCMKKQLRILKHCATDLFYRARMRQELNLYQPVRYCGFFHDHQGTTAAIQHMPTSILKYKIKTENYLSKYIYKKI
ncbi:uncharacterized protein LOC128867890 isoform X2 [Anastrepha ludens]|uniref:uncharacterized protein LOC128867890 isoform X2 n=1 Tax=Anastrepha ludens TaxID=28586 RepID=UPI0023B19678|nr:uncharacterized protein LOC128867890 isoform X2 [Anastrepha ludens]